MRLSTGCAKTPTIKLLIVISGSCKHVTNVCLTNVIESTAENIDDWQRQRSLTHSWKRPRRAIDANLQSHLHHYLCYTLSVYCRWVYRRADCKCDNAHSLGLCWNHFARRRGFCDRRFDCTTVLKTTGGFKISSRWISLVHHWCDCSCLNCETHQLGKF
jgi:hypothetical protein